jgi:pimeloyl-ACP methyl ester carboxylesterase
VKRDFSHATRFTHHDNQEPSKEYSMFREQLFNTGELHLNYAKGPDSGPPILFLHGLSARWQEYQSLMTRLTQFGHVYAPDLRGHGRSGRGQQYLVADYQRDITTFLQKHVKEPAIMVGHSWGALTALAVAAALPEQVRGLIMLDPPLCSREIPLNNLPHIHGWLTWIHDMSASKRPLPQIAVSLQQMMPELDDATVMLLAESAASVDPEAVAVVLNGQTLAGFDFADAFTQVQCPTLLLHGSWQHGAVVRDEDAAFAQTHLNNATIIKVGQAGHELHEEKPAQVWQHIEQFLQAHAIPAS